MYATEKRSVSLKKYIAIFSYQISRLSIYSQCDLLRKGYHVDTGIH